MEQISEKQFNDAVLTPSCEKPTVVLFSASWCGPCKVVKPRIERLSALYGFPVVCVDAGEEKGLAALYGVRGVPSLAIFHNAQVVEVKSGAGNLSDVGVLDFLTQHGFHTAVLHTQES